MVHTYPAGCLVIVADGTKAKMFRNTSEDDALTLKSEGTITPIDLENDGPAGHRPKESSQSDTDEATFAKQLAHHLNKIVRDSKNHSLILVANPKTLGQLRISLSKEATSRIEREHAKTLTNSTVDDIIRSLNS